MEFDTDITGYGRKMGMDAGLTSNGMIDNVVRLGDETVENYAGMQPAGTVPARTIAPGNTESSGGSGEMGDFAPTNGRTDMQIGNPRG
jgi:hypothetical protein